MRRAACLILGIASASPVFALDFRSVVEPALLYDAPSLQGQPLYAMARNTPVEAIVSLDAWVKVRDVKGDLAWIEKRLLSEKRYLMVRTDRAQIRSRPDPGAAVAFEADRDVLLELVESGPAGWVKVRHRDGQQGYASSTQVWGQ